MNKRFIPLLILLIFTIASCHVGSLSGKELTEADWFVPEETLTVWALSDTHIKNEKHMKPFRNAVEDVNDNVPDVDMAINAGDVADFPTVESYDLYIKARDGSYIKEWYEIIGNHDYKTDKGNIFRKKLRGGGDGHYTVEKGNILFIFLSNEDRGKATVITDETFEWWKDLVIKNQDKIIVVTSHAPLQGSGIMFSAIDERQITDSKRFREVLKEIQSRYMALGPPPYPPVAAGHHRHTGGLGRDDVHRDILHTPRPRGHEGARIEGAHVRLRLGQDARPVAEPRALFLHPRPR